MSVLIFLIVSYIFLSFSLSRLFPKAGIDGSKGWIPGVNFAEWAEIIGRKRSYAWRLLIPIYNIFVFCGMAVDMVRSFGLYTLADSALAVIYAPLKFFLMAGKDDVQYVGKTLELEAAYAQKMEDAKKSNAYEYKKLEAKNPYKKSIGRDWFESIVFAVFAAAFIRMFLIEAFVIPTPSMEGSLNVGDYLFVSKAHYGIRTPNTVLQVPLLHNRMPILNTESYLENPSLPYFRLPAIQKVKRGEPFVFNWPVGDSVYVTKMRSYTVNQIRLNPDAMNYDRELARMVKNKEFITRPVDKKDHYIKRAVAIPGDKLQVKDGQLYINDAPADNPEHLQFGYYVQIPEGQTINRKKLDELGIDFGDKMANRGEIFNKGNVDVLALDATQVEKLKTLYPGVKIDRIKQDPDGDRMFPHDAKNFGNWSVDNYGPLTVPKKGQTVSISPSNIAMYKRIIGVYEHNDLSIKSDGIYINGRKSDSYTFKQDYYWAMGDNRHNSEDSRMWGFVPFDHVVGKPLFIFFSTKEGSMGNGINWDRLFKSANRD